VIIFRRNAVPPAIALRREGDVPLELWHALSREQAAGSSASAAEVIIPLDQFWVQRFWLRELFETYDCAIRYEAGVEELLDRNNSERDEVERLLSQPSSNFGADAALDDRLRDCFRVGDLRPFQRRDLGHLLALSHGANFSVPGAGKTAVTYGCFASERARGVVDRALVIAPMSAFDSWVDEAQSWLTPAPVVRILEERIPRSCDVLVVNYDRLEGRHAELAAWVSAGRCHLILDEAHRIKRGATGEWGSNCLRLAHLAVRRDILSGTPAPNHPTDFLALMNFLWPNQATRILPQAIRQRDPSAHTMRDISRRLAPFFVRTNKRELGLDEPTMRVEYVQMGPLQARLYGLLRTGVRNAVLTTPRERRLFADLSDSVMYLLQAASNPGLLAAALGGRSGPSMSWPPLAVPIESDLVDQAIRYPSFETPAKFAKLATLVAENARHGRKTLIWSNFVGNLHELADRVLTPYQPALIFGGIIGKSRAQELRRFRSDPECMVLVANPGAMSEGVSLHHECHDAIYLDRSFNAGQYLQSVDRIHRLGLPPGTETRVTFLVCEATIDEMVDVRIRQKAVRLSQMLSDEHLVLMSLPDIEDYGEWIETSDLAALFGHLDVADPP
jgi:SNF2 family DNA or RNA helicase